MGSGISAGYAASNRAYWTQWTQFCSGINLDPHLTHMANPIPFLNFFAHCVRSGELAIHGQRFLKQQVEQCIRVVGQVLSSMGARNPCHDMYS